MNDIHDATEKLAYRLWQERGSPIGSPDVDWFRAEKEMEQATRAWDSSETIGESVTISETTVDEERVLPSTSDSREPHSQRPEPSQAATRLTKCLKLGVAVIDREFANGH